MDNSERSFQEEQAQITQTVQQAANYVPKHRPTGYCLACYEDVEPGKLYCNDRCAGDHAKKEAKQR